MTAAKAPKKTGGYRGAQCNCLSLHHLQSAHCCTRPAAQYSCTRLTAQYSCTRPAAQYSCTRPAAQYSCTRLTAQYSCTRLTAQYSCTRLTAQYSFVQECVLHAPSLWAASSACRHLPRTAWDPSTVCLYQMEGLN